MSDGLDDGDDGDDGLGGAGGLVAVADHLDTREGAHTVMYADHTFCIVGHERETVLYGVETRLSAIGNLMFYIEVIILTELSPVVLLCLRQYEYDLERTRVRPEALQCAHQDGFAANGQELFGNVASHPQAFSACYYNDIIHKFSNGLQD